MTLFSVYSMLEIQPKAVYMLARQVASQSPNVLYNYVHILLVMFL